MAALTGKVARDKFRQSNQTVSKQSRQPNIDTLSIRYGVVEDINEDQSRISVRLCTSTGEETGDITPMWPYLNTLSEVFLLWGALRKGLMVRVFCKGQDKIPAQGIVEILGDEPPSTLLGREVRANEIETGPYLMLMGGLLG